MKEFPDFFSPQNKDKLIEAHRNRLKCYLRRDLYEHILSHQESDYFSLDQFNTQRSNDMNLVKELVNEVILELQQKGWKCQLSFGGTGLFVYANEKPKNCWEDELG